MIAAVIVLPPAIARMVGASIYLMATLAALQLLTLMAFFITSLVSLGFSVGALIDKKWKEAIIYGGAAAIPVVTWCLATLTNSPGWEAVKGI